MAEQEALAPTTLLASRRLAVARRTVYTLPDPTFDSAVGMILGQPLDLRGRSAPADGWLVTGTPGTAGDIEYSALGSTFFSVTENAAAKDAWQAEVRTYEDIDHEVFGGRFDLIDVGRLRAAQAAVEKRVTTLDTAIAELSGWTDPAARGASGNAAAALSARLAEVSQDLTNARDQLVTPAPSVAAALSGAADALAGFAQQLSYVWWESNTVLPNSPAEAIQAIVANVWAYLRQNGALAESPGHQAAGDQAAVLAGLRGTLANYSSDAGGGLPPGMDPIAGDLTRPEVWTAANASITQRISTELDKLDAVVATQVDKVARPFQTFTDRLKTTGDIGFRARGRMLPAPTRVVGEPA